MLVVKRKKEQSLVIGDNIEIKIIDADENSVRIGIDAPRDVVILRKELLEQVEKQNEESTEFNISMIKGMKAKLNKNKE